MKKLFSALIVLSLVFTLASCGQKTNQGSSASNSGVASSDANKKSVLTIATEPGTVSARIKSDADAFMVKYPNVKVNVVEYPEDTWQSQYPQVITDANNKPDIAWFWNTMETYNKVVEAGLLEPLDDLYTSEGWDKVLPASTIKAYTSPDGHKYAVNTDVVWVQVIYLNNKIFSKLGIQKPKTFDELFAAGKTLKAAGYVPITTGFNSGLASQTWLSILTGCMEPDKFDSLVEKKYNEIDWNGPEFVQAYQILEKMGKELYPEGAASMTAEVARSLFAQGKSAMYSDGSWVASSSVLFKELPTDFDLGFMFFPQSNPNITPRPLVLNCNGLNIIKGTKNLDMAKKFLAFEMSYDRQKAMAENKTLFPSRTDMKAEDIQPLGKLNVDMNEEMNKVGRAPYVGFPYPLSFVQTVRKNCQQVIAGTMTGTQAAKAMADLSKK